MIRSCIANDNKRSISQQWQKHVDELRIELLYLIDEVLVCVMIHRAVEIYQLWILRISREFRVIRGRLDSIDVVGAALLSSCIQQQGVEVRSQYSVYELKV